MLILLRRSPRPHPDRERGASAVEYGLLVAAIAAVIVAVVFGLGALVRDAFNSTGGCLSGNGTSNSCPTNT